MSNVVIFTLQINSRQSRQDFTGNESPLIQHSGENGKRDILHTKSHYYNGNKLQTLKSFQDTSRRSLLLCPAYYSRAPSIQLSDHFSLSLVCLSWCLWDRPFLYLSLLISFQLPRAPSLGYTAKS